MPGSGGLGVNEAMAYGLPIISTLGDETIYDLLDGNGYLLNTMGNIEEQMDAIKTFMEVAKEQKMDMSVLSQQLILERASLKNMVNSHVRACKLLLKSMDIAKSARISFYTKLDKTYPRGVHIGEESYVAGGVIIFSHDFSRALHSDTHIGRRCFIGANAIVMCGITIGDEVIVGSGAIVTKDVPSNCIVAGNLARVIRTGIHTKKFGQLIQ